MNMERFIKSSLTILLTIALFGCTSYQPTTSKPNNKTSNVSKKKDNIKSKKDMKEKDDEETNKETANSADENSSQQVVDSQQTSNDASAQTPSDETSGSDTELLNMANLRIDEYWNIYYGFASGCYFEHGDMVDNLGEYKGYCPITDSRIHSLEDIESVWYESFSRKYAVPYYDAYPSMKRPFIEVNGQVYESYQVFGIVGNEFFFDHIVNKTSDEVWFAYYSKGIDGTIGDTGQTWSFVYEDGIWKFGTIIR